MYECMYAIYDECVHSIAILETIRDLMNAGGNTYSAFPNWLHDVFLGFGNPKAAVVRFDPRSLLS